MLGQALTSSIYTLQHYVGERFLFIHFFKEKINFKNKSPFKYLAFDFAATPLDFFEALE